MKNLLLAVAVLPFRIAPAFASDGHESEPGHRQLSYPRWVPLRSGGYYVREPVTLQNGEWSTARGSGLQRRQRVDDQARGPEFPWPRFFGPSGIGLLGAGLGQRIKPSGRS
jgi:hypothetical protein